MRILAALVAALALVLPAPLAHAAAPPDRLDRVSAALAKDPLYVDMDLADGLGRADRSRIKAAMRRASGTLGLPVYVAVIPNGMEAESYGRAETLLFALRERIGRDGLYVLADARAGLDTEGFGVPRRRVSDYSLFPTSVRQGADRDRPFADLPARVDRLLAIVESSPASPPADPHPPLSVPPIGQEDARPPLEAAFWGPLLTGLLVLGPLLTLLLYGAYLLVTRIPRALRGHARAKPSVRRLHSQAGKELAVFSQELAPDRSYSLRAYDAARILFDEVGPDPDRKSADAALDLVGVIVLVRQGRAALTEDRPAAPCYVNPLHGPSTARRKLGGLNKRPVCAGCARGPWNARLLRVPDGRPHHDVPGRWERGGFGSRRADIPSDVLESLGVT
ncbi:hypothetical protein [Spirillospora sp. NPDC029432]|uniref:hypothetical protein n=1 Tax=Spirillospora sp. NPDC029432 TaxID=3154599 RepID=UPI0034521465